MPPFAKLGGHLRAWTTPGQTWATDGATVKSLDVPGYLDLAGGKLSVFRHYFGSQDINGNGAAIADQVITALNGRHSTYIEGYNEIAQSLSSGLAQYVTWTQQFVAEAHRLGYKVAGFSFSTGTPSVSDWQYLRSVRFGGVDAVAMHCYWGNQGFTQNNALRFEQLWQTGDPPIVVTECGRDAVEGGQAGWMANGLTAQQFVTELLQYDQAIAPLTYVQGAQVFTNGGCPDFCNFEIDALASILWGGNTGCTDTACCQATYGPDWYYQNGQCVYLAPAPSPGLSFVDVALGVFAGLAIGGSIYFISQQLAQPTIGQKVVIYKDYRTIGADQPVPPGYVIVEGR